MKTSEKSCNYFPVAVLRILGILTLLMCLIINCWHDHLWGPDEPREAEIAREILQNRSWVVPFFNNLPFVEKPPLYYDVSAWIYSFAPHPGALRLHSAVLGILMLLALYFFARKKCGETIALCACAICVSMPQFYRAAHWILLDIGVSAWVTAALVCYGLRSLSDEESDSTWLAVGFFFFSALAMLTKGVVTIVYLGVIIFPHWLIFRRRRLPPLWTTLFFLVPVGIWIYLFYRAGGVYYLHEHFINNTVGRLLHREIRLDGSPVMISDVGHKSPLLFYFNRLPNMFGVATLLIPFAIAWAWREIGWRFFRLNLPAKFLSVWNACTQPRDIDPRRKEMLIYLLLWSFAPLIFFSIPQNKEVTYLLPSYSGVALLVSCYVADRCFPRNSAPLFGLRSFILPLCALILVIQLAPRHSLLALWVGCGLIYAWLIFAAVRAVKLREFTHLVPLILVGLIGGVLLGNTPELMAKSRLDRKCYRRLTYAVWRDVGSLQLCLTTHEESIRGALSFYGKRDIQMLNRGEQFYAVFSNPGKHAFLLTEREFKRLNEEPRFVALLPEYKIILPRFPEKANNFILLIPIAPLR